MSHFADWGQKYKIKKLLVKALENVFGKDNVKVHDVPVVIVDWYGRSRYENQANIVVSAEAIRKIPGNERVKCADLGFILKEDGYYHALADNYGNVLTKSFDAINKIYTVSAVNMYLDPYSFSVTKNTENEFRMEVK